VKSFLTFTLVLAWLSTSVIAANLPPMPTNQAEFEKETSSVVRNKLYYKPGKFEIAATGGLMPYDDVSNQYFVGGKLAWHLTDSFGWEILDAQKASASITSWANNLVNDKNITNLQTSQLDYVATTNILFSPFYGKIRVFGSSLVYFDLYTVIGAGLAGTKTVKLSEGNPESTLRTGLDPVVDFGLGFKFFLNRSMGIILDLRDYLAFTETYGKRSPKSNYTVFVGINFFLPSF
jgi:outer membrane beta-barrel protein